MASSATLFASVHQVLTFDLTPVFTSFFRPQAATSIPVDKSTAAELDEHEYRCRTDAWSDLSMYLPVSLP